MKTVKKICSILLAFCMIALLAACDNTSNNIDKTDYTDNTSNTIDKWVLTYEKQQYSDEFDNPSIDYEGYYEYDDSGKKVSEKFIYDDNNSFINSNFVYDKNDNLTYKSGIKKTYFGDSSYSYTYTYDENGNCLSELMEGVSIDGVKYTETRSYKYNEFGDIIETQSMYKSDIFERKTNYISTLTYEDDICIQDEIRMEYIEGKEIKTTYTVDKYSYDTNGNKSKMLHYAEIEDMSEAKNPVLINGRYYKLYSITDYTYEALKDVAITQETNPQKSTLTSKSPVSETEESRLSDSCDMLLCTGYDEDNYYELVANQIDSYPDSTFEFGVIKNNKWLIEMSSNCHFIDENGWWKGLDKDHQSNTVSEEDFQYIGGALFLYKESSIYNPESGAYFENLCNRKYTEIENYNEFLGFEVYKHNAGQNILFKYYNPKTGQSREVGGYFNNVQYPDVLKDISCGLFYASGKTWNWDNFQYTRYSGFFDLNGQMVLDLSEYTITDYHGYKYENNTYTITCKNNSGVEFDITFDTNGAIIGQTKTTE